MQEVTSLPVGCIRENRRSMLAEFSPPCFHAHFGVNAPYRATEKPKKNKEDGNTFG